MSIHRLPLEFYEPGEEQRGRWQTQCSCCEWVADITVPYQNECEVTECPECGSDDVADVNLDLEE